MNKVIPKIFSNQLELVISETLCCNVENGLQIHIPITIDKIIEFHIHFKFNSDTSIGNCNVSYQGRIVTITLTNFLKPLGCSLSQPLEFNIGKDDFLLFMYGSSSGATTVCLTLSIFRKQKND